MTAPRRGRRQAWLDFVPAGVWAALILALSTRPGEFFDPVAPVHPGGSFRLLMEMLVHFTQFAVFFALTRWALGRRTVPPFVTVLGPLAAVVGLSLLNESVQAVTTITRMFDVWDIAVDVTAGTTMALATAAAQLTRPSAWTPGR
jgi:hypothetical protein